MSFLEKPNRYSSQNTSHLHFDHSNPQSSSFSSHSLSETWSPQRKSSDDRLPYVFADDFSGNKRRNLGSNSSAYETALKTHDVSKNPEGPIFDPSGNRFFKWKDKRGNVGFSPDPQPPGSESRLEYSKVPNADQIALGMQGTSLTSHHGKPSVPAKVDLDKPKSFDLRKLFLPAVKGTSALNEKTMDLFDRIDRQNSKNHKPKNSAQPTKVNSDFGVSSQIQKYNEKYELDSALASGFGSAIGDSLTTNIDLYLETGTFQSAGDLTADILANTAASGGQEILQNFAFETISDFTGLEKAGLGYAWFAMRAAKPLFTEKTWGKAIGKSAETVVVGGIELGCAKAGATLGAVTPVGPLVGAVGGAMAGKVAVWGGRKICKAVEENPEILMAGALASAHLSQVPFLPFFGFAMLVNTLGKAIYQGEKINIGGLPIVRKDALKILKDLKA